MQQLSSRDCDKWLSMTLTMKERFSSAWRGGREMRERGGKTEGNEGEAARGVSVAPLCRPGCIGDTLKSRARFW